MIENEYRTPDHIERASRPYLSVTTPCENSFEWSDDTDFNEDENMDEDDEMLPRKHKSN